MRSSVLDAALIAQPGELHAAIRAQWELAETRADYSRNPRENSAARDERRSNISSLTAARDAAAAAAGSSAEALDHILYGD